MSIATAINPTWDTEVMSNVPAAQQRPTEQATQKIDKNYIWCWEPSIDDNGNVKLRLTERYNLKAKQGYVPHEAVTVYDFSYPRQVIIDFVEENCKPSVFHQVGLEGKLAKCRDQLAIKLQLSSTFPSESDLENLGFYYAIFAVFRSLISYDSYYGGGKYSGYDLKSKIGLS